MISDTFPQTRSPRTSLRKDQRQRLDATLSKQRRSRGRGMNESEIHPRCPVDKSQDSIARISSHDYTAVGCYSESSDHLVSVTSTALPAPAPAVTQVPLNSPGRSSPSAPFTPISSAPLFTSVAFPTARNSSTVSGSDNYFNEFFGLPSALQLTGSAIEGPRFPLLLDLSHKLVSQSSTHVTVPVAATTDGPQSRSTAHSSPMWKHDTLDIPLRLAQHPPNVSNYDNDMLIPQPQQSFLESNLSTFSQNPHTITFFANPLASTLMRDAILSHVHRLYDSQNCKFPSGLSLAPVTETVTCSPHTHTYTRELLPMLITLRDLHPKHLPTLLLLGCVLYAVDDLRGSMVINSEILSIDPNYVEAISNTGTTLKAMGRPKDAESWWWKAIQLRPVHWDAIDNLLGILCMFSDKCFPSGEQKKPRYEDALHVCEFVESQIMGPGGELLIDIPPTQRHRVQNFLYTHGSICYVMDRPNTRSSAILHYFKALDFLMRPSTTRHGNEYEYDSVDVVIAVCVAGLLVDTESKTPFTEEIAATLGISNVSRFSARIWEPTFNILRSIHQARPRLTNTLLQMGDGILPMILLLPDQVLRLPFLLFPSSSGVLPGLISESLGSNVNMPADAPQARQMTSTVLLTLARIFHRGLSSTQLKLPSKGSPIRASISLVLLFYYLALAIYPSPATCNNMGIILSNVSISTTTTDRNGHQAVVNGQMLAGAYYRKGLSQDSSHPHLLTNLGSLFKDQGKIDEAIRVYAKAVQVKPDFDVALANLGNAIKDTGRPQESIGFYQRAVQANPNFHEAVCGLASALSAVCDWRGRGGTPGETPVDDGGRVSKCSPKGWMNKVVEICNEQLMSGYSFGAAVIQSHGTLNDWLRIVEAAYGRTCSRTQLKQWTKFFRQFFTEFDRLEKRVNEGGLVIKTLEFFIQITQRRWYIDAYGHRTHVENQSPPPALYQHLAQQAVQNYRRPRIPLSLPSPPVPSVLPFHAFTYPLSPRTTRLLSYRNALRISYMTQNQSWLPTHVYPPSPPSNKIKVGYVSNDLNNHPLAHLMQSVFGFHDGARFEIHVYATSASDRSCYRRKIEQESEYFLDVSSWSTRSIVEKIVLDGIHLLVNLGGYTKGARNDIFAARPSPVQLQAMGFAGTLAAGWCDYLVSDVISCPPDACSWDLWRKRLSKGQETFRLETDVENAADPESISDDWMYTEHMIYMPHTFFVTDHKQSAERSSLNTSPNISWREEEKKRLSIRQDVFPNLPDDIIIFANFNQLYKIDPSIFVTWLRILAHVPASILWLLRFPAAGEEHLKRTAECWAGPEVASRVVFTDVAPKEQHLRRARVADLVLDTVNCSAHTVAADVLWSGTPIITWPKYHNKMCSRVCASIAYATGFGDRMVVNSLEEYESRAIQLAQSVSYGWLADEPGSSGSQRRGKGELMDLRRKLFLNRDDMPLFDTRRWTKNLERGFTEAWRRWVAGTCFENSEEWEECDGPEKESGSIWVREEGAL